MALNLDTRQRAMLQEMGITVWSPAPVAPLAVAALATPPAAPPAAMPATAAPSATHTAPTPSPAPRPAAPVAATPAPDQPAAASPAPAPADTQPVWQMAPAVALYPSAGGPATDGAWLILWECANAAQPLEGDSGKLLDNMLRALKLQHHPQVWLAGVQRSDAQPLDSLGATAHAHVQWQPLDSGLAAQLQQLRPARVLLLGLAAARAVLRSSEALGRLRAQMHDVQGVPAVVSYDPAYLLRSAHAKPAAWADLCRAHALQPPLRH